MIKSTDYSQGVMAVTNLARGINPKIGSYIEHFLIENFGFIVRLSNGGIKIPVDVARAHELKPGSVSKEMLETIADSFWTNGS